MRRYQLGRADTLVSWVRAVLMLALSCFIFFCWPSPPHQVRTRSVDLIELNTTMQGDVARFTQVILWNYSHDYRRYDVVHWFFAEQLAHQPYEENGIWKVKHPHGDLIIIAPQFRRTKTPFDPERKQRKQRKQKHRERVPLKPPPQGENWLLNFLP